MRLFVASFIFFMSLNALFASQDVKIHKNLFRTTFETVKLPTGLDPMGLLGINYLHKNDSNFYYGFGLYGSLTGQRGGFFSGGIELGYEYPISNNISLDLGGYLGGGSGENKQVFGDGLMLRLHSGLVYDAKAFKLGGYLSKVKFPGSKTDSNQFGVQIDIPFETVYANTKDSRVIQNALKSLDRDYKFGWRDHHIALTYQIYSASDDSFKNPNRGKAIGLIGFEYRFDLAKQLYGYLEASEAATGDAAGYAEILGGLIYYIPVTSNFGFNTKVGLGSGGGGGIDAEGGFLYKVGAGAYYIPTKDLNIHAEVGYVDAPQGNFSALSKKISFAYRVPFLSVGKGVKRIVNFENRTSQLWRFRASAQRYLASNTIRKDKTHGAADLLSFKFDRFINDNFYLTGQGFGASKGDIAGYGGGFLGFGYNTDPFLGNLSAYGELLIGTGGAGGVDSGEGLLAQPMLGLSYKISKNLDFQVGIGKTQALTSGRLDETIVDAGFVYNFRTIEP